LLFVFEGVQMIEITTDSCSDLSAELRQRFGIRAIPLQVYIHGRNVRDGELSLPELFGEVEQYGELPKTSAPPVGDFLEFFDTPNEIIYIGISSKLSATLPNAILAAQARDANRPPVHVIDSLNLSTGIGLLVLRAAELRDQGLSALEIKAQIEALVPKLHTTFVIDTLDYLYKGGRCSAMQHVVGSLLRIRPVIEVRPDGTLGVKEKIGGSRKKALNSMLDDFSSHLPNVDLQRVFVTHTGCDADVQYLVDELRARAQIGEICITHAGATIASHCGPDTVGILYFLK